MKKAEISRTDAEYEEILEYRSDKLNTPINTNQKNKKPNVTA